MAEVSKVTTPGRLQRAPQMLVVTNHSLYMFTVFSGSQFLRGKRSQFGRQITQASLRSRVLFTGRVPEVYAMLVGVATESLRRRSVERVVFVVPRH